MSNPARQNDQRTRYQPKGDGGFRPTSLDASDGSGASCARPSTGGTTNHGAERVKEIERESDAPVAPDTVRSGRDHVSYYQKQLSATDISALASMKNVANCDTWCELQNPVNHRVFERKLRPKPFGRGHVCLGVTHGVAPNPSSRTRAGGARCVGWPPATTPSSRLAQNRASERLAPRHSVVD